MLAMAPALLPAAPRRLKGFEMDGHCAVVAHHDHWEDEASGIVVGEWAAAGGDRRDAMMVTIDGAKVTRSTTVDEIRGASELCVQPKARR